MLALVRRLADRMGLRDWRIEVLEEPPEDEWALASCEPLRGRRYALLRLSERWYRLAPHDQRAALVHELIHCHVASACDVVRCELPAHLSPATYEVVWASFHRQIEYAVDGLTGVIAPLIDAA